MLCTFSFCLRLLKKLTRKLNLDTQTHIQTTRKKKKSAGADRQAGRQADRRARALRLSSVLEEERLEQRESLGLAVTQTEVFCAPPPRPQKPPSWTQRPPKGLCQRRMGNCVKSPLRNLSRKVCFGSPRVLVLGLRTSCCLPQRG